MNRNVTEWMAHIPNISQDCGKPTLMIRLIIDQSGRSDAQRRLSSTPSSSFALQSRKYKNPKTTNIPTPHANTVPNANQK